MADFLREECVAVGRYDPKTLLTRVKSGASRQLQFCELFKDDPPKIAISHESADLCRVAFGLGIPIITTVDTPYAEAAHRLTIPFSNYIVASKAIPEEILQTYNISGELRAFKGVDEVAWIKDAKPKVKYDFGNPLIVVREIEERAAYTSRKLDLLYLAKQLARLGNVVFLSRYHRKNVKGLIVPKFVDSASLVSQADLFVGVGGTITREAALQGTPAIVVKIFPDQHVNDFLVKKGFPIFETATLSGAVKLARKHLGKKNNVRQLVDKLENPVDIIEKLVEHLNKA